MALTPLNAQHKFQITAGTEGRIRGHQFERDLRDSINKLATQGAYFTPKDFDERNGRKIHIFTNMPATKLLQYISSMENLPIINYQAVWTGALATSGKGDQVTVGNGKKLKASKSDDLLEVQTPEGSRIIGISAKSCNRPIPTNDQIFFTTASAFCDLLRRNGINVSRMAEDGLSAFCGDKGFRPCDILNEEQLHNRIANHVDDARFFWEELSPSALNEWENEILTPYQDQITRILLKLAYEDDPFPPDYIIHKTRSATSLDECEFALFSVEELIRLSHEFSGYGRKLYKIRKGSHKDDPYDHVAPFFGFIQFQRGGQKQHPTQLQFNLKAGYFRHCQ